MMQFFFSKSLIIIIPVFTSDAILPAKLFCYSFSLFALGLMGIALNKKSILKINYTLLLQKSSVRRIEKATDQKSS